MRCAAAGTPKLRHISAAPPPSALMGAAPRELMMRASARKREVAPLCTRAEEPRRRPNSSPSRAAASRSPRSAPHQLDAVDRRRDTGHDLCCERGEPGVGGGGRHRVRMFERRTRLSSPLTTCRTMGTVSDGRNVGRLRRARPAKSTPNTRNEIRDTRYESAARRNLV